METNLLDSWDSNNGSPLVGPSYVPGRVGFALSNSVVTVPDAPSLHSTTGLTVQAWINGSSFAAGPYTVVSKYEAPFTSITATQSSYYFGVTNNHLFFMVSSNGLARTNVSLTSTLTLSTGQWYFVVATYDHTHLRLYINGTLSISKDFFPGIFAGTANLSIGGVPSGSPGGPTILDTFSGLIDEVAVYNRPLSADEISAIYNADGAGMCLTAPVISGPQNLAVPINEDAVFSVSVLGARPLTYQWRFNNTNIVGATNSTLYLERVQSNRVGNYSVAVTNQVGFAVSTNAALTLLPPLPCVAPPPGMISWWPLDRSAADAVDSNNGSVPIIIVPPFGSDPYTTGKVDSALAVRMTVPNSPSLNFGSNADFSWEGWIKVPPTNNLGFVREPTNTIVDKSGPLFGGIGGTGAGYSLSIGAGGHLALQLGFTPPIIGGTNAMFVAPGADLRDNHFHHVACTVSRGTLNGSHLYVDGANALTFDASHFSGVLSNSSTLVVGMDTSPLPRNLPPDIVVDEITLYGRTLTADEVSSIYHAGTAGKCKVPPAIIQQPQPQTVTETSNATFTVSATGLGLRYQWRFFSTNLPGAIRSSLTLSNVSIAKAGSYSVLVTNYFGAVTSSVATLTVRRLPVALCTNIIVSADANCMATGSVDNGSFDPDGGPVTLSQSPPGPYPLGTNSVTLTVTDTNGLIATCDATVTVIDTTPPAIDCTPQEIVVEFSDETGATVTFNFHAHDNCSGDVPVISVPPSGSRFPIGTNAVVNTATDASGNSSSCSFRVSVLSAFGVLTDVNGDLSALSGTVNRPPDANALSKAIGNLTDALDASVWIDQTHITRAHGESVFNNAKAAVHELAQLLDQKHSSVDPDRLQNLIDRIVKSTRLLAVIAIQDGADPKRFSQANGEVAAGDADISAGQYEPGIDHYRDAWKLGMQLAFKLSAQLSAGQPLIQFEAAPGDNFVIETSTNLIDWTDLDTVSADANGSIQYQDVTNPSSDVRYYRARRAQ
jgi:hypothetical protein